MAEKDKTFAEKVQEKRAQDAADFKEIAQTARIVDAINKQTKAITDKIDELITAVKGSDNEQEEPDEPEPKLLD